MLCETYTSWPSDVHSTPLIMGMHWNTNIWTLYYTFTPFTVTMVGSFLSHKTVNWFYLIQTSTAGRTPASIYQTILVYNWVGQFLCPDITSLTTHHIHAFVSRKQNVDGISNMRPRINCDFLSLCTPAPSFFTFTSLNTYPHSQTLSFATIQSVQMAVTAVMKINCYVQYFIFVFPILIIMLSSHHLLRAYISKHQNDCSVAILLVFKLMKLIITSNKL
jgi:hypothetical protein